MKTSNKLIFILALAFLFSLTSMMIYAKSNLVTWDESVSDSPSNTKEYLAEFSTNVLRLDGDYNFYLDNNSSGVKIDASEEILNYLRVSDDESLIFYTEGSSNIPFAKIDVYIGIKDKNELEIIAGNNARVRGKNQIQLESLQLNMDDNATINIDISAQQLNLKAEDNIRLNIDGFAKNTNLRSSNNASINAREFSADNLVVNINDNSSVNFDQAKLISGSVNDNSSFTADGQDKNEGLIKSGNASISIR